MRYNLDAIPHDFKRIGNLEFSECTLHEKYIIVIIFGIKNRAGRCHG